MNGYPKVGWMDYDGLPKQVLVLGESLAPGATVTTFHVEMDGGKFYCSKYMVSFDKGALLASLVTQYSEAILDTQKEIIARQGEIRAYQEHINVLEDLITQHQQQDGSVELKCNKE